MTQPNSYERRLRRRAHEKQEIYQSLKAKADKKKSLTAHLADWMTGIFGTLTFLILNAIFFAVWIVINAEVIEGIEAFDPYPFNLLTMAVSLEAIFLAIIVLISQNRAGRIADLRQEMDLQVNVQTEAEITKLLEMVAVLLEKNGVDMSQDAVLDEMLQPTDLDAMEELLEQQVSGLQLDSGGRDR